MTPWNVYWLVLQQDLWRLRGLLLAAGPPLVFLAIGVALVVVRRHGRPGRRLLGSTSSIAVFVSLVAGITSFLLGWGLAHLLFRSLGALTALIPNWFWIALWVVSFGIAAALSYRHCAAWVKACMAIAPVEEATSQANKSSPRRTAPLLASFTLSTLVAYQLILLLAVGIWIECRRDWAHEQYAQQQRLAEYARWERSLEERFESRGFNVIHSEISAPERYLIVRRPQPPQNWPSDSLNFLKSVEREDGLLVLQVHCDELTDADMRLFSRHTGLQSLELVAPLVTDAGVAELKNAFNLRYLHLHCPKLTDDCLDNLPRMQGLVTIESLNFTKEAVEAFNQRSGHPGVQIEWRGQPVP